jgi:hypothetical protein
MWTVQFSEDVSFAGFIGKLCDNAWIREEELKIGSQPSKRQPPKNPVTTSPLARSYLTRLRVAFSVRHTLRRPSIKFGSRDMLLPVR